MSITTEIAKLERDEIASALMLLKFRAGQLGLFKTMHAMEPATQAVGYELAEHIEQQHGLAKDDRPIVHANIGSGSDTGE